MAEPAGGFAAYNRAIIRGQGQGDYSGGLDAPTYVPPQVIIQQLRAAGWSDQAIDKYLANVTTQYQLTNPGTNLGDFAPSINRVRISDLYVTNPDVGTIPHEAHHYWDTTLPSNNPDNPEYGGPNQADVEAAQNDPRFAPLARSLAGFLARPTTTAIPGGAGDVVHYGTNLEEQTKRDFSQFPPEFVARFFPYIENQRTQAPMNTILGQQRDPYDETVRSGVASELSDLNLPPGGYGEVYGSPPPGPVNEDEITALPGWFGRKIAGQVSPSDVYTPVQGQEPASPMALPDGTTLQQFLDNLNSGTSNE